MNNYEHEIQCPDDAAIKKFLWNDYFHDSKITDINFNKPHQTVIMRLECCQDIDAAWDKLKGSWEDRHAYIEENMDMYTYLLAFSYVEYFHEERLPFANGYINGRFKVTAALRKLSENANKHLFHFRIQLDGGYIDFIFSRFKIRKVTGRVNYTLENSQSSLYDSTFTVAIIDEMPSVDEDTEDDEKIKELQNLYHKHDPELLSLSRHYLESGCEIGYTKLFATYIIGKLGDKSDLPVLFDFYLNIEKALQKQSISLSNTLLPKRNIMDAIEMIRYSTRPDDDIK